MTAKTKANVKGLEELSSGSWRATVSLPGGGRKRKVSATKAEAIAWKASEEVLKLKGGRGAKAVHPGAAASLKVSEYFPKWMATTKMRPSTARMYRSYYRNHIGPALGRVAVVKLNGPALDQFASELMAKESVSESTAARIVSIVAAMLMAARAAHLIDNEPWRDMRNRPVERKGDPRALDSDEVALVVAKAEELHGELYSTLWQTMAHCGFRISEALGLRVQDVDLEDRTIRLQFQLDRDTLKLAELKDGDGRTVGLPIKTAAKLAKAMEGKRPKT